MAGKKKRAGGCLPSVMAGEKRKWIVRLAGALAVAAIVALVVAARRGGPTQVQRLVGRWIRPDGGYVLEIREARPDGRLEAAYFNPRPIHVARGDWRREGGETAVFVELRDVNYPGSTYSLRYVPGRDRLAGEYFQAVQRQTFNVEFIRSK